MIGLQRDRTSSTALAVDRTLDSCDGTQQAAGGSSSYDLSRGTPPGQAITSPLEQYPGMSNKAGFDVPDEGDGPGAQRYSATIRSTTLSYATIESSSQVELSVTPISPASGPDADRLLASVQQTLATETGEWPYIDLTLAIAAVPDTEQRTEQRRTDRRADAVADTNPQQCQEFSEAQIFLSFRNGEPIAVSNCTDDGEVDVIMLSATNPTLRSGGQTARYAGRHGTTEWRLEIGSDRFELRRSRTHDDMHADVISYAAELVQAQPALAYPFPRARAWLLAWVSRLTSDNRANRFKANSTDSDNSAIAVLLATGTSLQPLSSRDSLSPGQQP